VLGDPGLLMDDLPAKDASGEPLREMVMCGKLDGGPARGAHARSGAERCAASRVDSTSDRPT